MVATLLSCLLLSAAPSSVLLYLPLDGAAPGGGSYTYGPGRQGQAVYLADDLRLPSDGLGLPEAGTFAAWVNFDQPGKSPEPRYLFCIYGRGNEGWQHSRVSIHAAGGQMQFAVWGDDGTSKAIGASIADWAAGSWHHIAATWSGLDGRGQGRLKLYLDGRPSASAEGLRLTALALGDTLDIGRDSDASPDYTNGWLDEVYYLSQAVSDDEVAAAAARPSNEPARPADPVELATRPGWGDPQRHWRARVQLSTADQARIAPAFDLPLDFATAAGQIEGTVAQLDPASLAVYSASGQPLQHGLAGRGLAFRWIGDLAPGQAASAEIYFDLIHYDLSVPLQARRIGRPATAWEPFALPDYATETYQDAWDFDEGDEEAIDQWGNAPELIRHSVTDGELRLQVRQDPWFIWGNMWSQVADTQRPVAIDLDQWHRFSMRVKQSVASAAWTLYARPEGRSAESLIKYDFTVSGTGWQTVDIDLRDEAHWRGRLAALRIDPTNDVQADVAIDWVRLEAVEAATVADVETVGATEAVATGLRFGGPSWLPAGDGEKVQISAVDQDGRPVEGQVVQVDLRSSGDAALHPEYPGWGYVHGARFTAMTGPDGGVELRLRASTRVSGEPEVLTISLPWTDVGPERFTVDVKPGPASQIAFMPRRPLMLGPGRTDANLVAQVADRFGNDVAETGLDISLAADTGAVIEPASGKTDAHGRLACRLTIDSDQRWVARVHATSADLSGDSPAVCITPNRREPGVAMNDAGQFTLGGRPWLPLGGFYANWVAEVPADGEAGRRNISFADTDDAMKDAWLKHLADDGVTAMRFMLRAHRPGGMEPLDIGGKVNPELYAELLRYLDLARPYGIRFLLVLHEDYTKPMYFNATNREQFCLPRWEGEDLDALPPYQRRFVRDGKLLTSIDQKYTDPDAIACQDQYAREIVGLFKDNPQVLGYELENEMVAVPASWVRHACEVIREVDDVTPIVMSHGGGGLKTADPQYWRTESPVDFYTYHIYPQGTTSEEVGYGRVTDVLTTYGRMSGRSFLGESVGDEWANGAPVDMRKRVARDVIWDSLLNANPGCMFWNHRGDETAEFALARKVADELDLASWPAPQAEVAVIVKHPLDSDRYYRTTEGAADLAMMARYVEHYRQRGAIFDFAWTGEGYRTTADLSKFAPPDAPAPIVPSAGWEAATRLRPGTNQGLCYLRNAAGVERWAGPPDKNYKIWFRTVRSAPATVKLNLGPVDKRFGLRWIDLVTGQTGTQTVMGQGRVELGPSDHDYVLTWR